MSLGKGRIDKRDEVDEPGSNDGPPRRDSQDRTVHAVRRDGWEIVRYDRAGKWWSERAEERFPIPTVRDAAEWAAESLHRHHEGRRGGGRFDVLIRKLQES